MTPDLSSLLIAALAFIVAFGLAKLVTMRRHKRRKEQEEELQRKDASRQVRRARERKGHR